MLEFKNVTRVFSSNKGIRNCSWSTKEKEIVGILGTNGCGKTTTFRILLQLEEMDTGDVLYKGKSLFSYPKSMIGYVPEERSLFQDAYVQDVLWLVGRMHNIPKESINIEIDEWLSRFQMVRYKHIKVCELSKGNQQLVQIICGLLHHPEIVIMDEPFNGLDKNRQDMVIHIIKQLNCIVLISFHQYELMEKICDHIVYMHDGEVVEDMELCHE